MILGEYHLDPPWPITAIRGIQTLQLRLEQYKIALEKYNKFFKRDLENALEKLNTVFERYEKFQNYENCFWLGRTSDLLLSLLINIYIVHI